MERDSFFGDPIVWTGRPKVLRVPVMYRVAAGTFGAVALISTLSAVAVKTALNAPIGALLLYAAWMAILVIGREFAVTGLRGIAAASGHLIQASDLGKTKMAAQVFAISLLLLGIHSHEIQPAAMIARSAMQNSGRFSLTSITVRSPFGPGGPNDMPSMFDSVASDGGKLGIHPARSAIRRLVAGTGVCPASDAIVETSVAVANDAS